jgi:hypothetical protein
VPEIVFNKGWEFARERTIEFLLGNFHNVDLPHKVPVRKKKAGLAYP